MKPARQSLRYARQNHRRYGWRTLRRNLASRRDITFNARAERLRIRKIRAGHFVRRPANVAPWE